MKGSELVRRVKALGRLRGVPVVLCASRGKGSHITLYYGIAFTIIPGLKSELKTGTFHAICVQLGIRPTDL